MATGSTLSEEFTGIEKMIDEIEQRMAFVVDRDELGDAMCAAVELGHRVHALQARLALSCTQNAVAAVSGHRTIGQYVAARTNTRAQDVDRLTRTAKWLRDYPLFEAAFGVELTQAHIDAVRKLDTGYHNHRGLIRDQQIFVDAGADCSFPGFLTVCKKWVVHNDPDGKEPEDQLENAKLSIRKGQGDRGVLTGECDAVTRHQLDIAIEHEAEKLRHQDKANGITRTASNRRMAALAALVKRGFAREDGTYPLPLGAIVMSQAVAEWALATLNGTIAPTDTVPLHPTDVDMRCELIDGSGHDTPQAACCTGGTTQVGRAMLQGTT